MNLSGKPRVSQCAAANHYAVRICLSEHLSGEIRRCYVPVSDDRFIDGFFDLPDNIPVGCPRISLCPRSAVNCNIAGSAVFAHLGKFGSIYRIVVPALAKYHGYL